MAKAPQKKFSCQNCGYNSPKWMGRCPTCGEWDALVEEIEDRGVSVSRSSLESLLVSPAEKKPRSQRRFSTGLGELDRVLGGGLVCDGFVLVGGDPGIGKSTILLQMTRTLSRDMKILYVSGEESTDQIRERASRLGSELGSNVYIAAETQLERVFELVQEISPQLLLVDSLQTVSTSEVESAPGSVSQLREVTSRLMLLAKNRGIAVWMVGHVTKDGAIAGPKVVEHMVDTVLYFEGELSQSHRILRTVKNRFGSTSEIGVFEMTATGLIEVTNPSSLFLNERDVAVSGIAITCCLEGTRPLLVELQALVTSSPLPMPRRTAVGLDSNRLALMLAIIEKHLRLGISAYDVFFNVAGGYRLNETASDLAIIASIFSSSREIALPLDSLFLGEVGLTGEVRRVPQLEIRVSEAVRRGFKQIILPFGLKDRLKEFRGKIDFVEVKRISELIKRLEG